MAGNHTMRALIEEGFTQARCEIIECSDADAIKINVGDNGWGDKATNDESALADLLELLGGDFEGTSYTQQDFDDMRGLWDADENTTPDLDKLADELGDPVDSDLWPTLRFKVPPEVRDDFYDLTNNAPNPNDDNNRFMHLIQKMRAVV